MSDSADLDFSRCRYPPFAHQREDAQSLVDNPWFFVASEPRTGKTKICIDAAQFLFERRVIKRVIVIAPAPVRGVWADWELGELSKHLWSDMPATVAEFHSVTKFWQSKAAEKVSPALDFIVSNFEYIRSNANLKQLLPFCKADTLLVIDESAFVKNWASQQTKATVALRRRCGRVVLLNGTPIFTTPMDLFSQGNLLHPSILECQYVGQYKARYAIQVPVLGPGGKALTDPRGSVIQKIDSWVNLDDLQRRFAPYTVRRLQAQCLDLPPKLDTVYYYAELKPATWAIYKSMKKDLVVWLEDGNVATSMSAAIKTMRLAQITSGFLGGIEDAGIDVKPIGTCQTCNGSGMVSYWDGSGLSGEMCPDCIGPSVDEVVTVPKRPTVEIQEIGREKLEVLFWLLEKKLTEDPNLHVIVWCRFRAELERVLREVAIKFPQFEVAALHGGQSKDERRRALRLMHPDTSPTGPVFLGGTIGTGSFGLNLAASHTCITMSSGYSQGLSAQMLDRPYGPGQRFPIAYFSIVATGPRGEKTIDHLIEEARKAGEDIALWTSAHWVKRLAEK